MNQDQNTLASMSDEALAELGLTREQVEHWDQIIERQKREAEQQQRFLDAMRDSDERGKQS